MTNQVEITPAARYDKAFAQILEYAGKRGFVKLLGFSEPHASWVYESGSGKCVRAWHYHWMYFFEINVLGGRVSLTVKKIDLLTFLPSRTETFEGSWDEVFEKLEKIMKEERIDRLDMEKVVTETIWTAW